MKRRSVRHWIAGILKLQPHIDEEERHSLIETGIRLGVALVTKKPAHESYSGYGKMVSESFGEVRVEILSPPPQFATYDPPEKQTDKIRPIRPTAKLLPLEHTLGRDTKSLPAFPGQWMKEAGKNLKHLMKCNLQCDYPNCTRRCHLWQGHSGACDCGGH